MTVSLHIQFERAEMSNNLNWFDEFYDTNKQFLDKHLLMTDWMFMWENFKEWKRKREDYR